MYTHTGIEIKVRANRSKRTFTIRKSGLKFRTYTMSKDEFNSSLNMTANDWNYFLKSNDYYAV